MKQFVLLCLFLCSSLFAFAQNVERAQPRSSSREIGNRLESTIKSPSLGGFDKLLVADTIFPATLSIPCADSLQLYFSDTSGIGFLSGTNPFFDLEKLQRITLDEATNFTIEEALVAFAVADNTVSNRSVWVNIYRDNGGENPLGEYVGTSDTLTVSQLALGGTFTRFPFSIPAELTDASSFILGVELIDVYFNELDSINYVGNVALFSTEIGCGSGNNSFETFLTNDGLQYETVLGNWGVDLEFYVGAIIERDPFTSTRNPLANYGVIAAPNPATENLTISFSAPGTEQIIASLLTTDGRVVRNQSISAVAGRVEWSVAELPAGLYLYQVAGSAGVQTGKVVIR